MNRKLTLERNIVVEILFAARRSRRRRLIVVVPRGGSAAAALRAAAHATATTTPAATGPTAEHLHVVGDDLGGKPVVALLVLPFPGAQFALDEHLGALAQIFGGDLAETAE